MTIDLPTTTADTAALVQHFLIYHGGRYTSRASEDNWKHVPVSLLVPEQTLEGGDRLPGGHWLVLPWDTPGSEQLVAWLERLADNGMMPDVVVIVMAAAMVPPPVLEELSGRFGCQLVGVSTLHGAAYGSPAAGVLRHLWTAETLQLLETVNPLEHLAALGDPRNPEVFFERMRRAGQGAPVTLLLIAVNVLVFVGMVAYGAGLQAMFNEFAYEQLRDAGANIAALTVGGDQPWRLLTCTFLHANLLHIAMNMWVLKAVGDTAERLFGSSMFVALYLLAGLGGSIASLGFTLADVPTMPSVGASGAVFGVMGGLLGFALRRRHSVPRLVYKSLLRNALFFTVINIALGLSIPQIDNAAHIGGLLVGFVCGASLSRDLPPAPQPSPLQRSLAVTACAGLLGVGYQMAVQLIRF